MLLAIDIGNTCIDIGLLAGDETVCHHKFPTAPPPMPTYNACWQRLPHLRLARSSGRSSRNWGLRTQQPVATSPPAPSSKLAARGIGAYKLTTTIPLGLALTASLRPQPPIAQPRLAKPLWSLMLAPH